LQADKPACSVYLRTLAWKPDDGNKEEIGIYTHNGSQLCMVQVDLVNLLVFAV